MRTKTCTICKIPKELSQFDIAPKGSRYKGGLRSHCRDCYVEYCHRPEIKLKQRARFLKKLYGLTLIQHDEMLKNQNGKCAICGSTPKDFLCVDHNHITGEVRGLLCSKCNKGLGILQVDSGVDLLQKAIDYVNKAR